MITVKLSYPSWWDMDWRGPMYLKETRGKLGIVGDYRFEVNNNVKECDYWFVYDNIDKYLVDTAICPPSNVILITGEVIPYWVYPDIFLSQFGRVISVRNDIQHPGLVKERHTCVWHVKKDFDFLIDYEPPMKTKNLSAIISDAASQDGHKLRYAFINKLKGHFKDELNWFGKGENQIDDKWDGLLDYKYSIAIENSAYWGYFTEKIIDCYLAYTVPFYFGCPNILDYFDADSLILIDPYDYKKSIRIIEEAIEGDAYSKKIDAVVKMRKKLLTQLTFFPFLTNWIENDNQLGESRTKKLIRSRDFFNGSKTLKQALYRGNLMTKLYFNGYT